MDKFNKLLQLISFDKYILIIYELYNLIVLWIHNYATETHT